MPLCPACSHDAPGGSRFCPACAAPLEASPLAATATSAENARPTEASPSSHPSLDGARFLPGAVLAARYRIIGLLGRGGMGEVYRADDLKLGQPVALKFLPQELKQDAKRLARFLHEVKIARQVSHANVCRVYDVGDVDGQHYLSMEYVDGEDLASLLRRIGRLPNEKAVQVARQICAGVAAAHEQGILHRDLKPANVMIDGRGRVKITDFGLAGLSGSFEGTEVLSGTPAYMSPEQFAGREVTVKSDLYALGLVLYELFTGKPAFDAATSAEMVRLKRESTPTNPSSHVEGLDPAVERVILRCLEKEPRERPSSALAVAGALPGGDPLAAALAAGETPSPEMVADAGVTGGLRPAVAAVCLVLVLLGLAVVPFMSRTWSVAGRVTLDLPPEALTIDAREVVHQAGYVDPPADTAYGFVYDDDYIQHVDEQEPAVRWRDVANVRPAPIHFWYRQSPRYLTPTDFISSEGQVLTVAPDDPAPVLSGMVGVRLDPQGRLLHFEAVPPQVDDSEESGTEPQWSALFERAGLDLAAFTPARPSWNPLGGAELRRAWEGAYPDGSQVRVKVEAGAYRGRPTFFRVVTPWTKPGRMVSRPWGPGEKAGAFIGIVLLSAVLVGGMLLARRNLRLGRGDRRGAFRVALVLFLSGMLEWVLGADHRPTFSELGLFFQAVAWMLLLAGGTWLVYIALEPYARKLWPEGIIAWNRVLQGRFRDPMVGRDILIGGLTGLAGLTLVLLNYLVPSWMDLPLPRLAPGPLAGLTGIRQSVSTYFAVVAAGLLNTVSILFLLLLLRVILRKQWVATTALVLLFSAPDILSATNPAIEGPLWLLYHSLLVFLLVRFGMLAFLSAGVFSIAAVFQPYTWDLSAWYAGRSLFALSLLAALAVYAYWVSLAGRPLFSGDLFDAEGVGKAGSHLHLPG